MTTIATKIINEELRIDDVLKEIKIELSSAEKEELNTLTQISELSAKLSQVTAQAAGVTFSGVRETALDVPIFAYEENGYLQTKKNCAELYSSPSENTEVAKCIFGIVLFLFFFSSYRYSYHSSVM